MERNRVIVADILAAASALEPACIQAICTSPPYWGLRAYQVPPTAWPAIEYAPMPGLPPVAVPAQVVCLGQEADPLSFIGHLVHVFRRLRPALRDDGTLWLNLGDSYASGTKGSGGAGRKNAAIKGSGNFQAFDPITLNRGVPDKNLVGIPWRAAFALQADGWTLRSSIPWVKENSMPESAGDRPNSSVELVFLFSKSGRYFFDMEAAKQCGALTRNWRNGDALLLLDCPTVPFSGVAQTSRLVALSSGEPSDGTTRIVSPDCPLHGDRPALPPTLPGDGRAADLSSHTGRNGTGLAPAPLCAPAPTARQFAPDSVVCSSDSPHLAHAPSATAHSKGSRRTGRAPVTARHGEASAETPSRTARTPPSPESAAPHPGTPASSTTTGASGGDSSPSRAADSVGTPSEHHSFAAYDTSCTCQFYREITEKSSHFSTWPPELVRPMVRAGSSDHGACAACGAPWRRVVERGDPVRIGGNAGVSMAHSDGPMDRGGKGQWDEGHMPLVRPVTTTGWQPTCTCEGTAIVPCLILDPFAGSGTTLAVAQEEGRDWLGIDADPRSQIWTAERLAALPVGRLDDGQGATRDRPAQLPLLAAGG